MIWQREKTGESLSDNYIFFSKFALAMAFIKSILKVFEETFMPSLCFLCGDVLTRERKECNICSKCLTQLPINQMPERRLIAKLSVYYPIEHATAFLNFAKNTPSQKLIHSLKYGQNVSLSKTIAHLWLKKLKELQWISDVDVIIPLPLHRYKQIKRGYNQSEFLCFHLGKELDKPVITNCLIRKRNTKSQASTEFKYRWINIENAFAIKNAQLIKGKHVLIVDDVITSGASLNFCIKALAKTQCSFISVAAIAVVN
jgi:ComF family protein